MVGSVLFKKNTITHLICRLAPIWEHKGGVGPFWKNPRINSEVALYGLNIQEHSQSDWRFHFSAVPL